MTMSNFTNYPDEYELKEVCVNFVKRSVLNPLMQEKGIFIINGSSEDLAVMLSHCPMQREALEDLRNKAFHLNTKTTLSGFIVKSTKTGYSLQETYENCRDNDSIIFSKGYRLGGLVKTTIGGVDKFKGRLDYTIRKPGRINFLDKEETHCEFYMYEATDGWHIEVDSSRANDGKEVQRLFSQIMDKSTTSFSTLDIDLLSDPQTIEFFDALIAKGMPSKDWTFNDVKSLTFKRGRESAKDSDIEDDDTAEDREDEGKESTLLTGIKNAILEGRNLRDDAFVKQFEENGCIFTAMTLEYQHKREPLIIQLRAEFKGSPKIFEVSLINSYKRVGTSGTLETTPLSSQSNLDYRSLFWNNARTIFDDVRQKK